MSVFSQKATMFDPQQIQQQQAAQGPQSQQQQPQQMYVEKKEVKDAQQAAGSEFPFYYNVNMLQKVHGRFTFNFIDTMLCEMSLVFRSIIELDLK